MQISLDTNVWIFGLLENNGYCVRILDNLAQFTVIVPNQIREDYPQDTLLRSCPHKNFVRNLVCKWNIMEKNSEPSKHIVVPPLPFQGEGMPSVLSSPA
jgi:predicted nucleic acid-binding protein